MHQFLRNLFFLGPIFRKVLTVNFKKNFALPVLLECNKKVKLCLQVYIMSHLFSSNGSLKLPKKIDLLNHLSNFEVQLWLSCYL